MHFEHLDCELSVRKSFFHVGVVYRPPPSTTNGFSVTRFLDEWTHYLEYLEHYFDQAIESVIMGDFNFHLDEKNNKQLNQFLKCMVWCNMRPLQRI